MSYIYYCMECHRPKYRSPRFWKGKTVCQDCFERLEKAEIKHKYFLQNKYSKESLVDSHCFMTDEDARGENKALEISGELVRWVRVKGGTGVAKKA